MATSGDRDVHVTALGPARFRGDLRWVEFEPELPAVRSHSRPAMGRPNYEALPVRTRLGRFIHAMTYGSDTRVRLRSGWDLVHAWEEPFICGGFQLARWTPPGTPFVFSTFQNIGKKYSWPFSWWERFVVARCDGWIAFGHTVCEALLQRPGYAQKPHEIIPPGMDTERFVKSETMRADGFQKLGWQLEGPPVIGFLGRFIPEKGLGVLMEALSHLHVPWRALFVGGGDELPRLAEWGGGFGGRGRVLYGVAHDDVVSYLNVMDILCAPSLSTLRWREQFGSMITEAFACGVAVVGSSSGEIPHTIGDAGVVVSEGDGGALASTLRQLIEAPERIHALGHQGRQRAEKDFAWPVVAQRHLGFFRDVERKKRTKQIRI